MRDGQRVAELRGRQISQDSIIRAMAEESDGGVDDGTDGGAGGNVGTGASTNEQGPGE
jgi:hypothetical protein